MEEVSKINKQAEKYAEKGNSTDKVGGKYTVLKVSRKIRHGTEN